MVKRNYLIEFFASFYFRMWKSFLFLSTSIDEFNAWPHVPCTHSIKIVPLHGVLDAMLFHHGPCLFSMCGPGTFVGVKPFYFSEMHSSKLFSRNNLVKERSTYACQVHVISDRILYAMNIIRMISTPWMFVEFMDNFNIEKSYKIQK